MSGGSCLVVDLCMILKFGSDRDNKREIVRDPKKKMGVKISDRTLGDISKEQYLEEVDSNGSPEGATTSQVVITPVKHQEPMLTTPSLKKSGLFGLRFPFSRRRKVC
ncbi:hypothetical protein YC2023_088210 [Brassica napus]